MEPDIFSAALIQAMGRELSVPDLIRTADTLKRSGQSTSVDTLYATWIQHNANHPLLSAVLFNHSVQLADSGKLVAARECLERAIALNPDFMPAYINLGRLYERLGNSGMAVLQWSAALARMASVNGLSVSYKTTALNQSARVLEGGNQDDAAESMLRQSLEIDRGQREAVQHLVALRQRQCKWPALSPSERVDHGTLMRGMSPLSAAAITDDPLFQLALAHHYNQQEVGTPEGARLAWAASPKPGERLRVGYLSSDLREHAVGYLMTEVFALHDRARVEVFAYYCGPEARDPLHQHFRSTADHWGSIGQLDDAAAAQRIEQDGIHILVDLNGYTREARLKLLALRPAPIVVNWLGFPGTMGSPYHQYILADDWIIPEASELYYSEKVLRLPCYQPSSRARAVASTTPSRADVGLPDDAVVYCCFNGAHKLTRFTLDRWLLVLGKVARGVLWLLASDDATQERLRDYAEARGIARERLVFAAKLANPFHLARYALADVFLDTTPYGAHTTASDALWMGVPVLTLSGRSFASRVCGSLVRAAGLPELVCESAEDFVERAVALGNDPSLLPPLRDRLRSQRDASRLFDMPLLVRRLEELYAQMAAEHHEGTSPRPDLANLDAYLEVGCQADHEALEVQTLRDYQQWWVDRLARRHAFRPLGADGRLGRASAKW